MIKNPVTPAKPTRLAKEILDEILTLPVNDQAQRVQELCGSEGPLRDEVNILLSHVEALGDFLEEPIGRVPVSSADDLVNGPQVKDYRLLRQIGQGGMGTVYLADKVTPDFEQRVALKIIRPEIDIEGRERFRREGQILARLEHTNIARLIDAGLTDDGRPFLAMEYVDGECITQYVDRQRLSVDQRIELFLTVCEAVQYAHKNMILHRDIKNSNVLISSDGIAKLLDFGIAKILIGPPDSKTLDGNCRALTPDYASPEQLRGELLTASTDTYSLGILLYRLLTGMVPFDRRDLDQAEFANVIEQSQPAMLPSVAVTSTTRERDRHRIKGDLDLISLKAIEFDPDRRYESPTALAEDLRRFLACKPIYARPHGWTYSLGLLVHRHRLVTALLVALVLGVGVLGTMSLSLSSRLRSERDSSLSEQARAEVIKDLLVEALESANPMGPGEASESVEQILDSLAKRVRLGNTEDPEVKAEVLLTLGSTNAGLGRNEAAFSLLDEALKIWRELYGENHPKYASTLMVLGRVWTEKGDFKTARTQLEQSLEILTNHAQASSRDVAQTQIALAWAAVKDGDLDRGEEVVRDALRRAESWHEDEVTAEAWDLLGSICGRRGLDVEAEQHLRHGLRIRQQALGEFHPSVSVSLNNLAALFRRKGQFTLSESHYRQALELRRKSYEPGHPHIVHALSNLGSLLHLVGKLDEAEAVLTEALDGARRTLGDSHLFTAMSRNNLASLLADRGAFGRAEILGRENIVSMAQLVGESHHYVSLSRNNVAWYLIEQGRFDEAEPLLQRSLQELIVSRGELSTEVAHVRSNLGVLHFRDGKWSVALKEHEQVLKLRKQLFSETHPDLGRTYTYLAKAMAALGEYGNARDAAKSALFNYATTLDANDWRVAEAKAVLGAAEGALGNRQEAINLLRVAVERLEIVRSEAAFETRWAKNAMKQLGPS